MGGCCSHNHLTLHSTYGRPYKMKHKYKIHPPGMHKKVLKALFAVEL